MLWLAGECRAASEKYWDDEVVCIEPRAPGEGSEAVYRGIEAARAKSLHWFSTQGIEDLNLDGPFVTGDPFALFADMLIVHAGVRTPHSQIVVFSVRDGMIIEERHFHE